MNLDKRSRTKASVSEIEMDLLILSRISWTCGSSVSTGVVKGTLMVSRMSASSTVFLSSRMATSRRVCTESTRTRPGENNHTTIKFRGKETLLCKQNDTLARKPAKHSLHTNNNPRNDDVGTAIRYTSVQKFVHGSLNHWQQFLVRDLHYWF